jgi:hypothetical protein
VRLERNKAVEEAREMKSEAGRMEKERDRVRWGLEIMEHQIIEYVCRIENKMLRMEMEEIRSREDIQECIQEFGIWMLYMFHFSDEEHGNN